MIFDAHIHYGHSQGALSDFPDLLADTMTGLGIAHCALFGIGRSRGEVLDEAGKRIAPPQWGVMNDEVATVAASASDKVAAIAYYRLDQDDPDMIDDWARRGFRGVKFLWPSEDYDHPKYYPAYERASARNLVMNFHTGLINGLPKDRSFTVRGARMRVVGVAFRLS
jgi:predicted TIM-barrel fold metal-dependent hydrolase